MSSKKLKVKSEKLKVKSKVKSFKRNNFKLLTRLWTLDFGLLTFITLLAALLRFYNLMWGEGFFFHPDERNMAASISQLCLSLARVTPAGLVQPRAAGSCSMNPHFFAYGAFPLYLAYFSHQTISFFNQFFKAVYFNLFDKWPLVSLTEIAKTSFTDSIFYLRFWSALASTFTVPLVYLITKELFANKKNVPLLAALLTAFTPGLIQAAHFGTTESLLTFFFMLILYLSLKIMDLRSHIFNMRPSSQFVQVKQSPLKYYLIFLGISLGLSLATKLTAIYFLIPAIFLLFLILNPQKIHTNFTSGRRFFIQVFLFLFVASLSFFLASPYNFLDFQALLNTSLYETKVASGEIKTFYTRQFENTTPLLFQLTHIFPYALGWPLFILGTIGFFLLLKDAAARWRSDPFQGNGKFASFNSQIRKKGQQIFPKRVGLIFKEIQRSVRATLETRSRVSLTGGKQASPSQLKKQQTAFLLIIAFLAYFLPNAFLFAKWTRFMTPIFPFFAIFAAYFLSLLSTRNQKSHQKTALRRILVHLSSLLKDWTLNLVFFISHLFNFVKSPNLGKKWGVEMPGVAPGRFGLRAQSSKLAIPTPVFIITTLLLFLSILPGLFFFQIYTKPDVRFQVSQWIYDNIPGGSYLLSETGNVIDIPLQITNYELQITNYEIVNFDFYHLDENPALLEELVDHLDRADYILTPSRRIFANHLRLPETYPITSNYYQALFDGRLGFELVWVQTYKGSEQPADAEAFFKRAAARWRDESLTENGKFASLSSQLLKKVRQIFPKRVRQILKVNQRSVRATLASDSRASLTGGERAPRQLYRRTESLRLVADEAAEETWTVFDHPVVRIFKKTTPHDKLYYQNILKPI